MSRNWKGIILLSMSAYIGTFMSSSSIINVYAIEQLISEENSNPTSMDHLTANNLVSENGSIDSSGGEHESVEENKELNPILEANPIGTEFLIVEEQDKTKIELTEVVEGTPLENIEIIDEVVPPNENTEGKPEETPIEIPEEEVIVVDEEKYIPIIGDPIIDKQPGVEYSPVEVDNSGVFGEEAISIENAVEKPPNQVKNSIKTTHKNNAFKEMTTYKTKSYVGATLPQTSGGSNAFTLLGFTVFILAIILLVRSNRSGAKPE